MIAKLALPYALAALLGAGATLGIIRATTRPITVNPTPCNCDCPEIKPANGIDFDKIKNVRGLTIQNHQYYVMGADTVSRESLVDAFRKVATEQKLSRCR